MLGCRSFVASSDFDLGEGSTSSHGKDNVSIQASFTIIEFQRYIYKGCHLGGKNSKQNSHLSLVFQTEIVYIFLLKHTQPLLNLQMKMISRIMKQLTFVCAPLFFKPDIWKMLPRGHFDVY